ncbi:MAG: DUF1648 domain-containing protein [Planctomycetaceae bacterium]|nr:DUF1648 domain-containing protein [Planctomycetaceae bacterium]
MKTKLPMSLLVIMVLISLPQHYFYYTQLPDVVATHFGADGKPNDWMTRLNATLVVGGIQVLVPVFLVAVSWLAMRLPESMLNIPNREYWLQPDKKEATLTHMRLMLSWIAVATISFMAAMSHIVYLANKSSQSLNMVLFGSALGIYLTVVFTIAIVSVQRFRLPKADTMKA